MEETKKKLVIGVIGADVHAVGNKILYHAFTDAGFDVINLGVMVSQEEYIAAAIETDADAIVVSSLYGQGELDCRGLREKCEEAGLHNIPLVVGGNIVIGKQKFEDVEQRFKEMGFDRAFPPNTMPETTIAALRELLHMDDEDMSAAAEVPEEQTAAAEVSEEQTAAGVAPASTEEQTAAGVAPVSTEEQTAAGAAPVSTDEEIEA